MAATLSKKRSAAWQTEPGVQLMLRVKHDEPDAFSELLRLFWPRVFGHFFRLFHDRQLAEDLAQDVFLRLFRHRKSYQPRANLSTWIFHIARNVAKNALRSKRRKPTVTLSQLSTTDGEPIEERLVSSGHESLLAALECQEAVRAVREGILRLGPRHRVALGRQLEDCSYSEIATELDTTPKAAKSLLYRARLQLRELLTSVVSDAS